jgi:hypothetical protein
VCSELIKAQTTGNASTEGWYMADESMQVIIELALPCCIESNGHIRAGRDDHPDTIAPTQATCMKAFHLLSCPSPLSLLALLQRRCVAAFGPPPFAGLRPPPYIAVDYFQLTNFTDVRHA